MADVLLSREDSAKPQTRMVTWWGLDPVTGHQQATPMPQSVAIERLIDRAEYDRAVIVRLFDEIEQLRNLVAEQRQMIFELRRKLENGQEGAPAS